MAEFVVGSSVTANQLKDLFRQFADGSLNGIHLQALLEHRNSFPKEDDKTTSHLKLISSGTFLTLPATDGTRTIAQAADVFTGGIDNDFKLWKLDVPSTPTKPMSVKVWEQTTEGMFADIFASTGQPNDALCIPQNQILSFAATYPEWLRKDGFGTFFMFKENEKFFVAEVYFDDARRLCVRVDPLSRGDVWGAEYRSRFVLPQLPV